MDTVHKGVVVPLALGLAKGLGHRAVGQQHEVLDQLVALILHTDIGVDGLAILVQDELHLFRVEVEAAFGHPAFTQFGSQKMEGVRSTNAKDGYAMQYALRKGYNVAIISGGYSETMRLRYKNFPNMDIFLKVPDKVAKLKAYMAEKSLISEQLLIMGDDIPDIKMMQMGALKCAPADAAEEVKEISDYVSFQNGGNGAVRDVIEQTLKAQNRWMEDDACLW